MVVVLDLGFGDDAGLPGVGEDDVDAFFLVERIVEFDPEVAG